MSAAIYGSWSCSTPFRLLARGGPSREGSALTTKDHTPMGSEWGLRAFARSRCGAFPARRRQQTQKLRSRHAGEQGLERRIKGLVDVVAAGVQFRLLATR